MDYWVHGQESVIMPNVARGPQAGKALLATVCLSMRASVSGGQDQ